MRIRKSGKVNRARHAQCIAEIITYRISFGNLKGRNHLEDVLTCC